MNLSCLFEYVYYLFKDFLDRLLAILLLILFSPLLLFSGLLIRFFMGKPIFFLQKRPGFHGKPFTIIKLRTMKQLNNDIGEIIPEHKRINFLGRILRESSIDELPELINIIKGDMSFIGPRPLLMEYLPLFSKEHCRRHNVKPGLTGWAQINGRNSIDWEEKFNLDVWYVDNISFLLDIRIFILTIFYVLQRKKTNNKNKLSMPPFLGYKS